MLAWMDDEALRRTRETRRGVVLEPLPPRSYWHKGETSGNTMPSWRSATIATATRSCSVSARPAPPVTPAPSSCFAPWLWRVVAERAATRPEGSYVDALLDEGPAAAAQKVGEEGVEAALAAVGDSDERLVEELADLWFHSYVLLAARGLDPARVEEELVRRHGAMK